MAQDNDHPDTKALGGIRPGDPMDKLAVAIGPWWREPTPEEAGWIRYLDEHYRFTARLTRDSKVGSVSYDYGFDPEASVAGLRMLMPEDEIVRSFPELRLSEPQDNFPYRFGSLPLKNGGSLSVEVGHGRVTRMNASSVQAVYPERPLPLPRPPLAFNVEIVPGFRPRGSEAPDGWCYGLPRGITQEQWPLSSKTGFPLEHHFTVRVPESYRVKGRQYVALAMFGDSAEESRRSPAISRLMNVVFDGRALPDTVEEPLRPFLDHLHNRHPMEFRAKDILYSSFAAIWLTQEEIDGQECVPPAPTHTDANAMCTLPTWLVTSATERFFGWNGREEYNPDYYLHRMAGGRPGGKWDLLAFRISEVRDDPNTGRTPVDELAEANPDGYIPRFSEEWEALGRDVSYGNMHFGGTASPIQAMPDLTPFYIEFDETPGMFNFGGGSAQFDLVTMQIDWAQ